MGRYRNEFGSVVNVDDELAARIGEKWKPLDGATADRSETPDKSWKVADLKAYAEENSIDLAEATKKDDILAAIAAGPAEGSGDGEVESDDE